MTNATAAGILSSGLTERSDRGVVAIGGEEAESFLNGLVTATVKGLGDGDARFGALLAPQGKVLFDFFLLRRADGFLVEIAADRVVDFVKRLGFYRLRSKVTIVDESARFDVFYAWGEAATPAGAIAFDDPRLPDLGRHVLAAKGEARATATLSDWHAHRIALGVPESGVDFDFGDVFPHDVDMDDLAGVDFLKGCFIGQEVVSRMKHRGTARKRFVAVSAIDADRLPPRGHEILVDGRAIGTIGSSAGRHGLAEIRLDRARAALDTGTPIVCDGVAVEPRLPGFARFGWPASDAE
jgi:folate-binding protein YgfZ